MALELNNRFDVLADEEIDHTGSKLTAEIASPSSLIEARKKQRQQRKRRDTKPDVVTLFRTNPFVRHYLLRDHMKKSEPDHVSLIMRKFDHRKVQGELHNKKQQLVDGSGSQNHFAANYANGGVGNNKLVTGRFFGHGGVLKNLYDLAMDIDDHTHQFPSLK